MSRSNFLFCHIILLFLFFNASLLVAGPSKLCTKWFDRAKIKTQGEKCVVECSQIQVDMGSFECPGMCDDLCRSPKHIPETSNAATGFFGFNMEELKLLAKYPAQTKKAYELSRVANDTTDRVMKRNLPNDESDAFRHFIWTGLMIKELGTDMTRKVLEAHESDSSSSDPERAMDVGNNREAISIAEKLKHRGKLTQEVLEQVALVALKKKRLIVIDPKGGF